MKVYICKACGFFGFGSHSYQTGGKRIREATDCSNCGGMVDVVDLSVEGLAKYEAIKEGLQEYERVRCEKKQIALFG